MALKKLAAKKRSTPPAAERVYEGEMPKHALYKGTWVLVRVVDAPDDKCFPKVNPLGVPPETFYVFDMQLRRCVHMLSHDADGVGIAWDTDRNGRYFLRAGRMLLSPRYVEYSYDTSNALKAGENWHPNHPNYRGSLQGVLDIGTYEDYTSPKTREAARNPGPSRTIKRIEKDAAEKRQLKRLKSPQSTKPLKRVSQDEVSKAEALMADQGALDREAEKAAADLTSGYGTRKPIRKTKPLKKIGIRK